MDDPLGLEEVHPGALSRPPPLVSQWPIHPMYYIILISPFAILLIRSWWSSSKSSRCLPTLYYLCIEVCSHARLHSLPFGCYLRLSTIYSIRSRKSPITNVYNYVDNVSLFEIGSGFNTFPTVTGFHNLVDTTFFWYLTYWKSNS